MEGFVSFNECQDVLASLKHCVMSLSKARDSEGEWKWVILSLHSAFQGAMVCHLAGPKLTNLFCSEHDANKWLEWIEKNKNREINLIRNGVYKPGIQKMHIAPATVLFNRLGDESLRLEKTEVSGVIVLNDQQKKSFETFNNIRNEFTHFSPHVWGMSTDFIKSFIINPMKDVLDVFEKIIGDPSTFRSGEKIILGSETAKIRCLLK